MHSFRNEFFTCLFKIQNVQVIQNDVIKCCKMMSSNVALLHSNNCCVLEPAICEDLDLHVVIFLLFLDPSSPRIVRYSQVIIIIYESKCPIMFCGTLCQEFCISFLSNKGRKFPRTSSYDLKLINPFNCVKWDKPT